MIKVGINGFGRIGRAIYRNNLQKGDMDIVAINDINPDIGNICYTLQYDTTYGKLKEVVSHDEKNIKVGEKVSAIYCHQDITQVPWDDHGVDIVIDASGIKSNLELEIKSSLNVKNFIVTNAPKGFKEIKTIIFGVNEHEIDPYRHKVFSSSICDTIAFSPILKVLQEYFQVESGYLTTLHPWLSYQNLLDGPSVSWSQPGDIYSRTGHDG